MEAELKRMEESWPVSNVTDGRHLHVHRRGDKFSKIDLCSAYLQMEMEEDSQKYTTINTHLGLYQNKQLVFGVEAATCHLAAYNGKVLQGIPGMEGLQDDMLISGQTDECHLKTGSCFYIISVSMI